MPGDRRRRSRAAAGGVDHSSRIARPVNTGPAHGMALRGPIAHNRSRTGRAGCLVSVAALRRRPSGRRSARMTITRRSGIAWASLADVDPELWTAIRGEMDRQRWKIELIASENYVF